MFVGGGVPIQRQIRLLMLWGLVAVSAMAALANGRWLFGRAYAQFAEDQRQWIDTRDAANQAVAIALKLQPFSAHALQLKASSDLLSGQTDQAIGEYEEALIKAPADAYLWRDYALALVYSGHFDKRLDRAVAQAQAWGNRSGTIQLSLAMAGFKVFHQSDASLRELWMHSIRYSYWDQPGAVLRVAYLAEEELLLCDKVIPKSASNPWCATARWRHGLCPSSPRGLEACVTPATKTP
jgi:tetratricopeptide (TPR) repeat protein